MHTDAATPDLVSVRLSAKGRDGLLAEAGRLQAESGRRYTMGEALEALLEEIRERRGATPKDLRK